MADFDVVVIGGGPAGHAAALSASGAGATVALVEAERPGGACVHHACIPTNILMASIRSHLDAREQALFGVFEAGETFHLGRAAARKDSLVATLASGIETSLRMNRITLLRGAGSFSSPRSLEVSEAAGRRAVNFEAAIIATGTRWEPPAVPGYPADRMLTADGVLGLMQPPGKAVVIGDSAGQPGFALEYAFLLAAAGSEVTLVSPTPYLLPGLDGALTRVVRGALTDVGVTVIDGATVESGGDGWITVRQGADTSRVEAEAVAAIDVRRPLIGGLRLEAAGIEASESIAVDRRCETSQPGIFAAGDVAGGPGLTNAATQMGEVAGLNAAGGNAVTRLDRLPRLLHTVPEVAWVGLTEAEAKRQGHDVCTGMADLGFNARAVALGARQGVVKVVADGGLGEIVGVHAVGPEAAEILSVATALMQAEATLDDLAAMTFWHPSTAEGLVEAARRAAGGRRA